jgi:hypothetical protein
VPSRNGYIAEKLDSGGYVVGPGSAHPDVLDFRYHVLIDCPIADAPVWLIELCQANAARGVAILDVREWSDIILNDFVGALICMARTPTGSRNSMAYWTACRARELAEAGILTQEFAEKKVLEAACQAGLARREALRTIQSAMSRGAQS